MGQALARKGYPVTAFYRYASYNQGVKRPGHVFAVWLYQGKEIWLDPVPEIHGFNASNILPVYVKDKKPNMSDSIGSLYDISGIGQLAPVPAVVAVSGMDPMQALSGPRLHWLDEPRRGEYVDFEEVLGRAHKPKKHHKGLHIKIKPGKLFSKVGLAPSRNAFLTLVKLNTFNLATKMWTKAAKHKGPDWDKLTNKWKELGGNPNSLYKNIREGVNTHNKLHPKAKVSGIADDEEGFIHGVPDMPADERIGYYDESMSIPEVVRFVHNGHACHMRHEEPVYRIGVAVVAAAGIIAAAAPIIAALTGLLKGFGVHTDKGGDAADQDAADLADKHNDAGDANGADANGDVTHDDGTVTNAKTKEDGTQEITIKKLPGVHNKDDGGSSTTSGDSGGDEDAGDEEVKTKTKTKTVTKSGAGGAMALWDNVTGFVSDHKMYFIIGGGLIATVLIIKVIRSSGGKKPVRRR